MEKNFFDQFDSTDSNSSGSSSDNFFDQFDAPTPKRKKSDTSERSVTDIAKDTGITALKGLISVPEAIIGLADIPTGGRVGKKLDDWGFRPGEAKQVLDEAYSEPQQAANRAVREAEGFVDTASAAIQNPSTIATTVGESIPQMLGGAAVARGVMAVAPKVVPWVAGAIGEGVVGAGSAASSIRGETEDGLLTGKQAAAATASGVGTALLGAAGGKVAQKLGIGDVDTLLAQGGANLATKNSKGFVRQLAEGGLTEGVFEELPQSIQEQMLQNFALDKPLTDGVGNAAAMGLLAGVATGGAAGGFNATTQRFESKPEPQNEAIENPETSTENAVTFKPDPATPATTTNTAPSDLEQRLVEIELLAEQRELTPDEFSEYESIASQIEAEEKRLDSELSLPPEPVEQDQPVGSQNVASATDDEAVRALKTPVQLTALDRAQQLDVEIGQLSERLRQSVSQSESDDNFSAEQNAIAIRAQELAMERDEIAKTWPKAVPGIETEFSTESGAKIQGQYAIMDAADLVTSNDENLKANPLYPKELQPRDRSRQASEIQISGIVGKLDPARLGVSADAATGAPIVGADGLVESGNARTIALKRVYQANGQKAEDYKSFLRANAQQFGLTPEQIDQVQKPVLVRVRSTPVNRAEFARQANASTVQRMSPSEAALSDASRLTSLEGLNPDENGDFDSSIDFIRQFMATLPITEQSDMLESDGRLSTTGYRRIQNAVLAKAYGDSPTLRRMTESRDDNLRNITKALTFAAPTIAAARERIASGSMYDADIASDLIQAVEGLSSIKQRGWTVDQELAQTDLTGPKYSEESAELLNFLDQNIRSPRRIAEFMQRYYEALEAAGDPNQGTMFDEPVAPTRQGLINQARGQNVPTTANTERGLDPEAAQVAQESGGQPQDAPGNQGRNQGDEGPGTGTGTRSEEGSREDANWVNYPEDSGTLGIPRAQMPQIKSEARGALVQFLKARGIDSESKSVPASQLKPTQAEYSADKVKRFIESGPVDGSRSVLISSDNHVLDGHHQWMTFQAMDKDVPVIQLNAPIRELLEQVYEFPSAKRSEGAPAESGTETTAASNSPFPTISETKAPSIGPMGSAKITPIAPGKPLFRQTNLEGLDDVARYDNQAETINLFVTDNVDLALGQNGNKGVLVEFRPDSLSGTENVKPGTGDATGREYKANVMAKRPIAAVTMNAVDFPRLRGVTRNLLKREFTKSVLGDGIVQYKRNGLEVTGETGSIASKGISKTVPKTKTTGLPIAAAKKRNTEDAGEELVANKRNRPDQALTWNDLKNKEATLRVNETTKANVYPKPNYEELVQGGMDPLVAHMVKQAYDSISPKPQVRSAPTDQDLQLYIEAVNIYMKGVTQWATDEKVLADWLKSAKGRSSVRGSENAPKIPLEYVYPTGWRNNRDQLMIIGGNKALSALQPGYAEIKKATRDLEKGWPKKVEAWVKQGYQIVDGSKAEADFFENSTGVTASVKVPRARGSASIAAKSFPGLKQGDKEVSDLVSSTIAQFKDSFIVLDKQGRNKGAAKSIESAEELARQLVKRKSSSTEVSDKGISVLQAQREGPDYRMEGEDISSERFLETFGFRGVNFGNWMKGKSNEKERQLHLNHAYDSFMDLAALLNLPPQAMSLNGLLGIAFGAQGRSGAAAHFVPGVNEINLTRESGAGSLGHEWGHALDHYFARLAGLERDSEPFITEHANSNPVRRVSELVDGKYKVVEKPRFDERLRPEILDKFKAVVDSINKRELTPAEMLVRRNDALTRSKKNVDGWLNAIRKDLERVAKTDTEKYLQQFDGLADKVRTLDLGDGAVQAGNSAISPTVDSIRSLFKSATGRIYSLDQIRGLQSNVDSFRYFSEAKDDDKSHIPQFVPTDFSKNAQELDGQKGGKAYWNTTVEKFARAFDAYLTDRLAERAQVNSYLSHTGRDGPTVPQGEERKAINTAFDALVGEFKTREEDGGVVLFNRETASPESGDLNETPDDIVRRVLGVDTATARAAMDRVSFPWQNRSNNIKSLADRRDALEVEALSVLAAWKNPPRLVVVESLQDSRTPPAIRRLDDKQRAQGASGSIPGFFFDNTVYLVTDSVKDRASMVRTLAHESFVHYGFRNVYGSALDGILTQLYQARPDLVKKKAKQYGMDISDKRQRLEAAEEVLAEMAETDPNLGFVRRAIAAIRTWLRANFPFMNQLSLTDDEILQNFIAPARNWVKNGTRQATLAPAFNEQNPAFSRSADITTSEQFKKWFGDWQQAASARMPRAVTGLEQARDTAKTFVGKPIVNRSTELVGMVSNTNLSKMASQKAGDKSASMPDHALAIANLDRLFENAVLDHSHPDNKGEPTIKAIRRYIAPMFGVNGDLRAVKLTVKETTGPNEPNPIYTVEAMEIENPPSVLSRANPDATGIRPQAGLSSSVKTMLNQVNDVSKVVDKEGKPLVVYHGTTSDIAIFDTSKTKAAEVIFTTPDPAGASTYAETKWDGGAPNVMPLYVSIKNPAYINANEYSFDALQMASTRGDVDGVLVVDDSGKIVIAAPFESTQIKSATGNRGTFDSTNPDIRFSRTGLNGSVPPTPGPKQQSRYSLLKEKLNDLLSPENIDTLIYNMQDRFIDLKRLRDHIKEIGGNVSDLNDVYLGEELYHKRLAKRVENFLADEIKPLMAQLRVRNVTTAEFEHYLHARHAPEANKVLAERNPNQEMINKARKDAADQVKKLQLDLQSAKAKGMATKQIEDALANAQAELTTLNMAQAFNGTEAQRNALSGMSDSDAINFMTSLTPAKLQAMKDLAAMVDAMNEKTLQTLEQYGLETKKTVDGWRNEYKYYVPLFRDEDHADRGFQPTGQGFSTKGSSTKSRIGSNAKVTNILGHIAIRRENALTRGEKNRVAKQLYLLAMQNKDPNVWQVDKPPTTRNLDSVTGFVRVGADNNYRERPNVVMVRVAGVDRAVVFNERNPQALRAAGALKNLDMSDLGALVGFIQKGTRWFASVNTQYNPVFGLINFARDVQSAILNLSTTPIAGKEKEVTKHIAGAMRAIYRDTRGKPSINKDNAEWMRLWNEMQLEGGATGYRELFANAKDRAKALTKEIDALDRGMAKKAAYAVVDWLSDYNETMENAVRVAAYKTALDQGLSKPRAASISKNLTVNFNRKGAKGQTVGAWYAFFNAAIQGTTRMVETLSGPSGRKIMLGGVALGMTSSMIAMAMMGGLEGDEDDDEYSKIPDFVRERSLIIPLGATKYIALPLPLGFHVIPNIGRIAMEAAFGRQDIGAGKRLIDMIVITAEAFNPIGGFGTPSQMIAPTVLDPLAALTQNADWTGAPIYKEDFSSLNPTPGFTRTKDTASTFSKLFAEAINKVTGGTDYMPGSWSPTPDQLDYMIGQLTGGVGREALKLTQFVGSPFTGEDLPAYKIPIIGRVYGTTEGQAGQAGKFYENIRDINKLENEVKGRAADGKDFEQFIKENPMAELYPMANAQERYVRALREDRRRVIREGLPGFREKAKQYDEDITKAMKDLNQEVQKATDIKRKF